MTKTIKIENLEELKKIEEFVIKRVNPYKGYKARDFTQKCKDLSYYNGRLYHKDSNTNVKKMIIYKWEVENQQE